MDDAAAIAAARIGIGEVENGIASTAFLRACRDPSPPSTSIDVLEITKNEEPHTRWFQGLDHDALVRRCAESADGKATSKGPSLRILFLNITPLRGGNRIVLAHPKTLEFLRKNFSVSLLFLDCLGHIQWGAKSGNACNDRYDDAGNVVQTNALYHFHSDDSPCDVWFSQDKANQKTTYIISNCSAKARIRILLCADSSESLSLLCPMVVDTILADAASERLKTDLQDARGRLLTYEKRGASQIPTEQINDTFQSLHSLSQTWHILYENLIDHEEALAFVLAVHDHMNRRSAMPSSDYPTSNNEAMRFLQTRNTIWKRWCGNYNARTQIRINLYFNLASQGDNKINIEIANTSKKIAEATLRDSSSMITIATMTMIFLPGTFVSAVLSMVFFNNGTDASGNPTLEVLPQWWIFPVTTVPLTLLVFVLWRIWQQKRLNQKVHADAEQHVTSLNMKQHASRLRSLFTGKVEISGSDHQATQDNSVKRRIGFGIRSLFNKKSGVNASVAGVVEGAP